MLSKLFFGKDKSKEAEIEALFMGKALYGLHELPTEAEQEIYKSPTSICLRASRHPAFPMPSRPDPAVEEWIAAGLPTDSGGRVGERDLVLFLRARLVDAALAWVKRDLDPNRMDPSGRSHEITSFYDENRPWLGAAKWVKHVRPTWKDKAKLLVRYDKLKEAERLEFRGPAVL